MIVNLLKIEVKPPNEKHQKTEGHLRSNQRMHRAAPVVRVFSAF